MTNFVLNLFIIIHLITDINLFNLFLVGRNCHICWEHICLIFAFLSQLIISKPTLIGLIIFGLNLQLFELKK